jgi:predicted DNA-binding protein with PD1-like motif
MGGMKSKMLHEADGQRTFALVLDIGDEVVSGIRDFATRQDLTASHFTAIGAFSAVVLGYFDWKRKDYLRISVKEQVEVLSLIGNVVQKDGEPQVHAHVVLGKADGTAHGGHLLQAHVRPTLEVIVVESPEHLRRAHDEASGLALIKIPRAA